MDALLHFFCEFMGGKIVEKSVDTKTYVA